MMEVYEMMLFAIPLWFGLVATLFALVFGRDVIAYFSKCGQNPVAKRIQPVAAAPTEEPRYEDKTDWSGKRELVLH